MLKINYNNKINKYDVFIHPNKKLYAVTLTDNNKIPIEIIKNALEEQYNIKIKCYNQSPNKRYSKYKFKESNEFSYYFKIN